MTSQVLAEVRLWTGPQGRQLSGWAPCDGRMLSIPDNIGLYEWIGNVFGGNVNDLTFALPNLPPVPSAKGGTLIFMMSTAGAWPQQAMEGFLGETRLFPLVDNVSPIPQNWTPCNGVPVAGSGLLRSILSNTFGGNNELVGIPNLTSPAPNLRYILCTNGVFPRVDSGSPGDAIMGDVRGFAGNFTPHDFIDLTQRQSLPIQGNEPLYSILGDAFGKDGSNFSTPQLAPLDGGGGPVRFILDQWGFYPHYR